jgi:3alpha(or 20beta)-hydroxysteroid dehydrogenase
MYGHNIDFVSTQDQEMDELMELTGKIALITGAAQGQGAAEARILADHGATVIVADLDHARGIALADSLPRASFLLLDVARADDWAGAAETVRRKHGHLDILVNNAAISHFGSIATMPFDDLMRVMAVNLGGTFLGMQAMAPLMAGRDAVIVNVSSISGLMGRPDQPAYLASKWAVRGLTRAAALEFASQHIRVNCIVPGLISTEMTLKAHGEAKIAARGAALPAGRAGTPEDIANLLLFLTNPASAFCTGAEFVCDGGETTAHRI